MPGPLGIESDIIARLRAQIAEPATVASGAAIDAMEITLDDLGEKFIFPLITVMPGGGETFSQAQQGRAVALWQTWNVSILVRHVTNDLDTDYSVLDTAIESVLQALNGWGPTGRKPMVFQSWAEPVHHPGFVEMVCPFLTVYNFITTP